MTAFRLIQDSCCDSASAAMQPIDRAEWNIPEQCHGVPLHPRALKQWESKLSKSLRTDISTRKTILKPSSSASVQKTLILSLGSLGHCFYSMLTICTPFLVYSLGCMQRMLCRNTRNASIEAGQDGRVWKLQVTEWKKTLLFPIYSS